MTRHKDKFDKERLVKPIKVFRFKHKINGGILTALTVNLDQAKHLIGKDYEPITHIIKKPIHG